MVGTQSIQVAFKYLRGWNNHNLSEQCLSVFSYPHRKKKDHCCTSGVDTAGSTALVVLLLTGTSTGWRNGLTETSWSSTRGRTKFCSQKGITPYIRWARGRLEIILAKKALWILLDIKLNINYQACHSKKKIQQPPELPQKHGQQFKEGDSSLGTGCPTEFWRFYPWRYSRSSWRVPWATCCSWPCLSRVLRVGDTCKDLYTSTTLWVCVSGIPNCQEFPLKA